MMFEEVAPADTVTNLHIHHDSDEVTYVLSGEVTFMIATRSPWVVREHAVSTLRSSARGTPRGLFGNNGWRIDHSKSVNS
jgi:hypothetical protein